MIECKQFTGRIILTISSIPPLMSISYDILNTVLKPLQNVQGHRINRANRVAQDHAQDCYWQRRQQD